MRRRILIVDDEIAIRKMLTIAFTKAGYEVWSARDAPETMDLLAIEKFDAVLSDVQMTPSVAMTSRGGSPNIILPFRAS